MTEKGNIIVVSGPSGVGKSTILKKFLERNNDKFKFSVSYTSRKKRENEVDGVDYFFITKEEFIKGIENNIFLEWALVHNNYYGTSKEYLNNIINSGYNCILDIDVQGAMKLMNNNIKAKYIFIAPPSFEDLKNRLLKRGTESTESLETRINNAIEELKYKDKYDYIIVNNNITEAVSNLEKILLNS